MAAPLNAIPSGGEEARTPRKHTYHQILKSSALIGGSSMLRTLLGVVRNKALALLIGPSGIGLLGVFQSIIDMAQSLAGMGISSSGVRQIAEATATENPERVARTVTTLRRVALILAIVGSLGLVALSLPVARFSFPKGGHVSGIALLSIAVFFGALSAAQLAVLQGMRRIADIALANVIGAFYGTLMSVAVVYIWREQGVVPSLICVGAAALGTSWWYSRKVNIASVSTAWHDVSDELSALLKLGFVFMATGLMANGASYLVRTILLRKLGEADAGCYVAAWALGGQYVSIVLLAMGADFFPRLTAAANNNTECNHLVNEQAEVSLLLAGPGVLATLTFAPQLIHIFYTPAFEPAIQVLRWICLGMMLRVVSWPMGFILLAKGAKQPFFWSEFAANLVQVAFVWFGVRQFGLNGGGMAFFAGYVFYLGLIYFVVRWLSGFRWTSVNRNIGLTYAVVIAVVFIGWRFLPPKAAIAAGTVITLVAGYLSLKRLCTLVPLDRFPKPMRRVLQLLHLDPASRQNHDQKKSS